MFRGVFAADPNCDRDGNRDRGLEACSKLLSVLQTHQTQAPAPKGLHVPPPISDLTSGARGSGDSKRCPESGVPTFGAADPQQCGALEGSGTSNQLGITHYRIMGCPTSLPVLGWGWSPQPCDCGVTSASSPSYPGAVGVTHTSRDYGVPPHVPTLLGGRWERERTTFPRAQDGADVSSKGPLVARTPSQDHPPHGCGGPQPKILKH